MLRKTSILMGALSATVLASCGAPDGSDSNGTTGSPDGSAGDDGYRVALSMSYSGNDWQGQARNAILASAQEEPLSEKVEAVDVFVSGTDATTQISQIQQMINEGYDAIIMYPISPTALNNVIQQGCDRGVEMWAYDATVDAECAHNVTFDQEDAGKRTAEHLSDLMGDEGNVVLITGVAGTSVDEDRTRAAKEVFAERGITVLDECAGDWAQGPAGECMSRFLGAFDDIDGVWAQVGGVAVPDAFDAAGRDYVPMIAEAENLYRLRLMDPEYQDKGLVGGSYGAPPWQGAAALTMAVDSLENGTEYDHIIDVGYDWKTVEDLEMCETGSVEELEAGCNTFPADLVPPGFMADWWSEEWTPNVDLETLLTVEEMD